MGTSSVVRIAPPTDRNQRSLSSKETMEDEQRQIIFLDSDLIGHTFDVDWMHSFGTVIM